MIHILVIDDDTIFKDSLQHMLLKEMDEIFITSIESHKHNPLYKLAKNIDIVFIDLEIKHFNVVEMIQHFMKQDVRVVLFVPSIDQQASLLLECLTFNIHGVLLKNMDPSLMMHAISLIFCGQRYMPQAISILIWEEYILLKKPLLPPRPQELLTEREWEVLELLSIGMSNREISQSIFLSENTIKNHVASLLKKLTVKDRTSAVIKAYQNGWINGIVPFLPSHLF
ncbi:response regulator transcription factor [Fictibacillus sp. 18YEL24]|uniref:response regulator transcription factor n=1 Tax=Fictibacillus sp. 18YEL24 TaxID=2745875 RepID=UPI0018CCE3E4|nr:response regulator transcription factor [Fictibacillus sp. 18YEL24]MBH0169474.1 response regulator transcription factor [Fictibacillus sp. 18YEL24]